MRFAVDLPNFGIYFHPRTMAELAYEAEQAGWDGFFIWDHVCLAGEEPFVDPWVALAAIAMMTDKIRIGAMATPIARRRPWKLARETVSIDHLSDGRLIVGIGLGAPPEPEYGSFGEETDAKIRANPLDEPAASLSIELQLFQRAAISGDICEQSEDHLRTLR